MPSSGPSSPAARAAAAPSGILWGNGGLLAGHLKPDRKNAYGPARPAVAAIKEKGVLSSKRIERAEVGGPGEFETMNR
jgi:hypothetical protein